MSTTQKPAPKLRRIDYTNEFKVTVGSGDQQKTFTVAKDVLVKSSRYLRAACSKAWNEEAKTVSLADQAPHVFAIYLQFIHTGQVVVWENGQPPTISHGEPMPSASARELGSGLVRLVQFYILAEMLLDVPAKNAVVDHLLKLDKLSLRFIGQLNYPVDLTYKGTTEGSPLRRLLIDLTCLCLLLDKTGLMELQAEFLADLTIKLTESREEGEQLVHPCDAPQCFYHEHDDEFPACSGMIDDEVSPGGAVVL